MIQNLKNESFSLCETDLYSQGPSEEAAATRPHWLGTGLHASNSSPHHRAFLHPPSAVSQRSMPNCAQAGGALADRTRPTERAIVAAKPGQIAADPQRRYPQRIPQKRAESALGTPAVEELGLSAEADSPATLPCPQRLKSQPAHAFQTLCDPVRGAAFRPKLPPSTWPCRTIHRIITKTIKKQNNN
jgi:hypothetical protein